MTGSNGSPDDPVQMSFKVNRDLKREATKKAEHGELSEVFRDALRRFVYGEEAMNQTALQQAIEETEREIELTRADRDRLNDELDSLKDDREYLRSKVGDDE